MDKRDIINSKEATQEIIGNWLLWSLILQFCFTIVLKIIGENIQSNLLEAVITLILQGVIVFFTWKISTAKVFKNKIIILQEIPKIMKNLTIFTIIICLVSCMFLYYQVNATLQEFLESNYKIKFTEKFVEYVFDEEEKQEYYMNKNQAIKEAKKEIYIKLTVFNIALTVIYIAILPLEKKELENFATVVDFQIIDQ